MDLDSLDSWTSLLCALIASGIVFGASRGIGAILISSQASVHLQTVVGLNALGLFGLTLGWIPQPIPLAIIAVVGIALSWKFWTSVIGRRSRLATFKFPSWSGRNIIFALALLFTLGPALTYPSGWDELMYHLELPRRWLIAGALNVQSDLPYSALPSLPEIVSWLVAPIEHLVTPRLITWILWAHGIFLFHECLTRTVSTMTADVLTCAVVASSIGLMISANAYVESLIWANTAALCSMLLVGNDNSRRTVLVAGLVIGGAIATKMTAVGLVAFLPVAWALSRLQQPSVGRYAVQSAAIAILFATPFYMRSLVLCGNPFSPYYAEWFTTDAATIQTSEYHHALAIGNFGIKGWLGVIAGPFALAFAKEVYDGTFGIQWIAIISCGVLAAKNSAVDRVRYLPLASLAICVWLYLLWSLTSQQARFGVPFLMVGTLASASFIDSLKVNIKRITLVGITTLTLICIPWTNFGYYLDSWLCVLKVRTPIDYIRDGVGDSYTELALFLHSTVKPDDKVVTLFEHRLAYLPASVEIATPYFQSFYFADPIRQAEADEIIKQFKEHDIRYVVLTLNPLGPDVSPAHIEMQQAWFRGIDQCLAAGALKIIWRSENHAVAQIE